MITRIRYSETCNGLVSFKIPLSAELTVHIHIEKSNCDMRIVNSETMQVVYLQICPSMQRAKRAARRQLEKMGLNFNNEIRRKK